MFGVLGLVSAPQVHRGARALVLRGDGVSGGHGGPGDVVLGPLSLACGRVMRMLKCGARVLVSGEPRRAWPRISCPEVWHSLPSLLAARGLGPGAIASHYVALLIIAF